MKSFRSKKGPEAPKTLSLEADAIDPAMNEVAEHCRTTGLPMKIGLTEGHQISLQRVPEAQLKRMTPEQRKRYEEEQQVYSNYTARMNDKVSQFDGQDDLFRSIEDIVVKKLNELKDTRA